eukprot:4740800-Pleurochrysis_carterae.AAC.2
MHVHPKKCKIAIISSPAFFAALDSSNPTSSPAPPKPSPPFAPQPPAAIPLSLLPPIQRSLTARITASSLSQEAPSDQHQHEQRNDRV